MERKLDAETEIVLETSETLAKKRVTVMGVEFVYIYLFGIICAFIGWVAENAAKLIAQGVIDCRFHMLPFLSPYALIPFAFQILLGDPDRIAPFGRKLFKKDNVGTRVASNLLCILFICGAVFLGELAIGNMWEMLFGVQLWNYGNLPLHVTQYAGLIPTLGYGLGAYLIFSLIYKPLLGLLRRKVKFEHAKAVCLTLGIAILLDTSVMCIHIAAAGRPPMYWQAVFGR